MRTAIEVTGVNEISIVEALRINNNALGSLSNQVFFNSKKEAELALEETEVKCDEGYSHEITSLLNNNFNFKKVYKKNIDNSNELNMIYS